MCLMGRRRNDLGGGMNSIDLASAHDLLAPWREALYKSNFAQARNNIAKIAPQGNFRLGYPFGPMQSGKAFFDTALAPLIYALPDLERRDYIVIAGEDDEQNCWLGCAGQYMGSFLRPWLDIPPTGHVAQMRFHEFYRLEKTPQGKLYITEMQAIWDIPELILQANAWPLSPALGREWPVPAPATQDGINPPSNAAQTQQSRQHIVNMLQDMIKHPTAGPEAMRMEQYWHRHMNWYGPAGIGSARTIAGFRHWHQIPFLNAMPDRGQQTDGVHYHFFAQGNYVAVTGWPVMKQTLSHAGWLGIAPNGHVVTLRSLDFWRLEDGKIRENWVMVDLLDMYAQIGVDVFARLKEFNKARHLAPLDIPLDYTPSN